MIDERGAILKSLLDREEELLEHAGELDNGREVYGLNRTQIADLASPYIDLCASEGLKPSILEVGGGQGNAVIKVLDKHPSVEPSDITMTSLKPLGGHKKLKERGVHVFTGVMAESLPNTWTDKFEVLLTSTMMQWIAEDQTEKVAKEYFRVLRPKGMWFGLDDSVTVQRILEKAQECGFTNVTDQYTFPASPTSTPFVLRRN